MTAFIRVSALTLLASGIGWCAAGAYAAPSANLDVRVEGVANGQPIPAEQAVCLPTSDGKSDAKGKNLRPTIRWSGAPAGTKSVAIFIMDPDVPADFTDAGKEGKTIAENAKRQDFYHYGIIDIQADTSMLAGGDASAKPASGTELVNDMGLNKYVPTPTAYGGPCPPWNDARMHHYHFIVLALDKDAPTLMPSPTYRSPNPADPMTAKNTFTRLIGSKNVLAKGVAIGTYTLNRTLREQPTKR